MLRNPERFNEALVSSLALFLTDCERRRFLTAAVGAMENYMSEDRAIDCLYLALSMTHDDYTAFAPPVTQLQIVGGTGIRQQSSERSQGLFLVK